MNLYLLRHGIAEERGTPGRDSERPLTGEGKDQLRSIGKAMKKMDLPFDRILSSPYVRARQTAEIVSQTLKKSDLIQFTDALICERNPAALIQEINAADSRAEEILLVGHEPFMSRLISMLLSGKENCEILFKKGGLCRLEVKDLKWGQCACLRWLLTPKQLMAIASKA